MAQTGYTPIQLYRTTTAAATPSAVNLADGELAINTTDEKLYFKNAGGSVKLLAANVTAVANGGTGATDAATARTNLGLGTSSAVQFAQLGLGTAAATNIELDVSGGIALNAVAVSASDVDLTAGTYFTKTAAGNLTWTFSNTPASRVVGFVLQLTNGGAYTMTWPASVDWPSGTAPTLTSSGVDILVFITNDGGTTWRGAISMKDSK